MPTAPTSVEQSLSQSAHHHWNSLLEGRFEDLHQWLQPLLDAHDGDSERELAKAFGADFTPLLGYQRALLPSIDQWCQQHPESVLPWLACCSYWTGQARLARSTQWADQVSDTQWQAAHAAQSALFVHAIALAQRGPLPGVAARMLLSSVQVFNEPDWVGRWLRQGQHPMGAESDFPADNPLLQQMGWSPTALPTLPSQLPEALLHAGQAHTPQEGEPEAFFWLLLALRHCAHPLDCLRAYAFLRTPRWGGSLEEILWLADSPMAATLSEEERNAVRLVAWLDQIDPSGLDTDDHSEIGTAVTHAIEALGRPLPEPSRGHLHLNIGELHYYADHFEQAASHYAQAATSTTTLPADDSQLMHMLQTAANTGMQGQWLGSFAARSRNTSAHAAAIYGLLCDNGWCGIARDPAIAAQWYAHASTLHPNPGVGGNCPFNDIYYAFEELIQVSALQHMAHCAASLGYPEMQFALGYFYSEYEASKDPAEAIKWYSLAAEQNMPRALYNLSLVYDKGADQGGIAELTPDELLKRSTECELRCLEVTAGMSELTERDIVRANSCIQGLRHTLAHRRDDPAASARLLAALETFGHDGWPVAMLGLAHFHADSDDKARFDYDKAVYWCEAAHRLSPDDAEALALRSQLQAGFMGTRRYNRSVAQAGSLPGQNP